MKIALIAIAYNGYDEFIPRFINAINNQVVKPDEVVIVLGDNCRDYGWNAEGVKFIRSDKKTMGELRNVAIDNSTSDYILYFSIDDILMPNAIKDIKETTGDIIALKYMDTASAFVKVTPEIKQNLIRKWVENYTDSAGYIAFKRGIRYDDTEFPNYPLLFKAFKEGYNFNITNNICAIYVRRQGSHSRQGKVSNGLKEIEKYVNKYLSR